MEPEEAARVFGKDVAANLKLNHHGNVVLYPQPTDDPNDPQNVSVHQSWQIAHTSRFLMKCTMVNHSGLAARKL